MSGSSLSITQDTRLLKITSPLGPDVLVLRRLSVTEAIGQCYLIEAETLSSRADLTAQDLVGKAITCTIAVEDGTPRHFHGIVRSFSTTGSMARGLTSYRLEAVPRLWHLSRTADCRIFQEKSAKSIIETLFSEGDVAPSRFGNLPSTTRPYTVQFNETDLQFVERLLDEVGGGYFFQHTESDHTVVVSGANADFPAIPGEEMVVREQAERSNGIYRWQPSSRLQPGKHVATDFDGVKPGTLLQGQTSTVLTMNNADKWEMFFWPGGQAVRPDHDASKLPMEQAEAGAEEVQAQSGNPAIFAGGKLKVKPSLSEAAPVTWLVTHVRHEAHDETQLVGGGDADYGNSFVVIKADRTWRSRHPRRRPVMPGLQSAIVTGPSGEEIHCDSLGRVKVHFHWDRKGKKDDSSTCWVRVSQPFAGKWGGTWFLPRVGDEVLVAFLDGDPDRPVVVGSLYNEEMKPPFTLPDNKTQGGFSSRSSKGGGASNANILRFDDKKGSEEFFIQAEKDLNVIVKHDETRSVDHDRTAYIKNNDTLTVKEGNLEVTVEKGNEKHTVSKGNYTHDVSAGSIKITAAQQIELIVGADSVKIDTSSITLTVGGSTSIKMDNTSITLTAGANTIKMDPSGVSISGAPNVKLSAAALAEISGALVKIN